MIQAFFQQWWKTIAIAVLVAVLCYPLGRCDGRRAERARNDAARAEANVEALRVNQNALTHAADERVTDAAEVSEQEEGLIDAIQSVPDTQPDSVRVQLGCERLRRQGTDISTLPACGGHSGGNGAEAPGAR